MSKADRHSEALLGIHLAKTQGRAQGSPPSDEELALLMDGELESTRRSEVLSHLANRPDRYRQWLSLSDMDADETSVQAGLLGILTNGLNNWLIDWRYAAGGIGAMAAVVLLVNQMALPPTEKAALDQAKPASAAAGKDESFAFEASELSAAAPAQEQALQQKMAEQRAQASKRLSTADTLATTATQSTCIAASDPASSQSGELCAVSIGNESHGLHWQASTSTDPLPLIDLPAGAMQMQISADTRWLAIQSLKAIYVFNLPAAFKGTIEQSQLPFTAGTSRMRWDDNTLVISVMQALGDSDDDLIYRYEPNSGDIIPPAQ